MIVFFFVWVFFGPLPDVSPFMHVRAHAGTKGNERADALVKRGSKLRFDLMELETPDGWFTASLERY